MIFAASFSTRCLISLTRNSEIGLMFENAEKNAGARSIVGLALPPSKEIAEIEENAYNTLVKFSSKNP